MRSTNLAFANERREDREEVYHRAAAMAATGESLALLVVNISLNGLMARCDHPVEPRTTLTFHLPGLAPLRAEVRWTLGGRLGCEFVQPIPIGSFIALLPRLRR